MSLLAPDTNQRADPEPDGGEMKDRLRSRDRTAVVIKYFFPPRGPTVDKHLIDNDRLIDFAGDCVVGKWMVDFVLVVRVGLIVTNLIR